MLKDRPCAGRNCKRTVYRDSKTGLCSDCYQSRMYSPTPIPLKPADAMNADRDKAKYQTEISSLRRRYDESLKTIERQERELRAVNVLGTGLDTFCIEPKKGSGTSEATPVLVASDWHVEENVGAEVGGLNKYNLDIARARGTKFFQSGLRLVRLLNQDVTISNIVLPLLGDFITNDIHDELSELTEQLPVIALTSAQTMLLSGIEFLLKESPYELIVPCHSGNHARTTKTTHFSAENGHSLEYLMYLHLATYFRREPRVKFIIPEAYHSYLSIYDTTIRLHHGHAIKYGGGVGGIFIPTYKAIAQWNKARHADLDVFGHFHQCKDGGNFLCNGSLIGYNGFALSIKADFEPPKQQLFLIDKKRGRTCTWPILVN